MKLLRIKWENIITPILGLYSIYCILSHIVRNGFQIEVIEFEIVVYALITFLVYMSLLGIRRDLLEQ